MINMNMFGGNNLLSTVKNRLGFCGTGGGGNAGINTPDNRFGDILQLRMRPNRGKLWNNGFIPNRILGVVKPEISLLGFNVRQPASPLPQAEPRRFATGYKPLTPSEVGGTPEMSGQRGILRKPLPMSLMARM